MADVNQLHHKATQLYKKGRIKDAKKLYLKIVKQMPRSIDALNMYGIACAQTGELSTAAEQFSKIIKLEPKQLPAYENLARIYMQANEFSKAQSVLEKALVFAPGAYTIHFGLGGALMSQNFLDAALSSFNAALAIDATQSLLFTNIGTVLSQLDRVDEAVEAFQKALALEPGSAQTLLRLGQLYIQNNNFTAAEDVLIRAQAIVKDDFDINLSLADAYQHNGKADLAIKHYFAADNVVQRSQNIYTKLDKLLLYSGDAEKKKILDRLAEEHVYNDWSEAVDVAIQLAELTEYHDAVAVTALKQFFSEYHPESLHPREWWQQKLKSFGDVKYGHDKILRGIHSAVFSWSIPDRQTLTEIADFVAGTRLHSYGAGSALWERLLSDHFDIDVLATDFSPRHSYLPIAAEDYSKSIVPEGDTVLIAWIIRGDTGIFNVLNQIRSGQKLVLIGEPPDETGTPRICATPEMFALLEKDFTLASTISLVSYSMLNDTVSLYIKN